MQKTLYLTSKLKFLVEEHMRELPVGEREAFLLKVEEEHKKIKKLINRIDRKERAAAVHSILDMALESLFQRDQAEPICRKGCSFCCHVHIVCTYEEAKLIKTYMKENSIEIDLERARIQSTVDDKYDRRELNDSVEYEFLKIPYEQRACLFLKDNICQIYPVRPCHCRVHFSGEDTELVCDTRESSNYSMMKMIVYRDIEMIISAYDSVNTANSLPKYMLELQND